MSQFSAPISPDVPVKFHPPPYSGKREDYIAVHFVKVQNNNYHQLKFLKKNNTTG